MDMNARMMRAKCMLRNCLQYMEGGEDKENKKEDKAEGKAGEKAERDPKKKARNNPFAIANAAKKKRGMSEGKTENLIMDLKKRFGQK